MTKAIKNLDKIIELLSFIQSECRELNAYADWKFAEIAVKDLKITVMEKKR